MTPSPLSKNYSPGEGTDAVAFHTPFQVDNPAQRPKHTEDLHIPPAASHVVDDGARHLDAGGTVAQRVEVSDRKLLGATTQGSVRQSLMVAIWFAS